MPKSSRSVLVDIKAVVPLVTAQLKLAADSWQETWIGLKVWHSVCYFLQDVKFPLILDVYELCTAEVQEKMLPVRSKFKEIEDKNLEMAQKKVCV